jgi:hypothetical protein
MAEQQTLESLSAKIQELQRQLSELSAMDVGELAKLSQQLTPRAGAAGDPTDVAPLPPSPRDDFVDAIPVGIANASGVMQLMTGRHAKSFQEERDGTKNAATSAGEFTGEVAEFGLEMAAIGGAMVRAGLVPLGKTLFPKMARAGAELGAQAATQQARLGAAEAIHGTSQGYGETVVLPSGGAGVIVEATVLGGLFGAADVGIAKVWRLWRQPERAAAARVLGIKPDATKQQVVEAFQRRNAMWNPRIMAQSASMTPEQATRAVDAVKQRFYSVVAARDTMQGVVARDVVGRVPDKPRIVLPGEATPAPGAKLILSEELTKPLAAHGLSPAASFDLARRDITSLAELQRARGNTALLSGTSDATLNEINSLYRKMTGESFAEPDDLLLAGPRGAGVRARPVEGQTASFLMQLARDTGDDVLPLDSELRSTVLDTMKRKQRSMERFSKERGWLVSNIKNRLGLPLKDGEAMMNTWNGFEWSIADLENHVGVPLMNVAEPIWVDAQRAQHKARQLLQQALPLKDVLQLTADDNKAIVDYLFSPETRKAAAGTMTPRARDVAGKLQALYQGDVGKQAQQATFYNWSERKKMPSDIWRVAGDKLLTGAPVGVNGYRGVRQLAGKIVNKQLEGDKLASAIKRTAKKYFWSDSQRDLATAFFTSDAAKSGAAMLHGYPAQILAEGRAAHAAGKLPEWIAQQPRWGMREFYYMTQPGQRDAVDDWIASLTGLREVTKPAKALGTIPSEAHARVRRKAQPREGSVVLNSLKHFEKLYTFNAVHDNLKLLYGRLNTVGLTTGDFESLGVHLRNVMGLYVPQSTLGRIASSLKGAFYRGRLSPFIQPGTLAYAMARDSLQAPVIGAISERPLMLARLPLDGLKRVGDVLRGVKPLERIDPQMAQLYARDFQSLVSNKMSIWHEHLMVAAGRISKDFKTPVAAARAAEVLQRSAGLYTMVDEASRALLWSRKYQDVKKYATLWLNGTIKLDKFLRKTSLDTLHEAHLLRVTDWLNKARKGDTNAVAELSALAGRWATDGTLGVYKTGLRPTSEQSLLERALTGTIVFPRTVTQQLYYHGVKPMIAGAAAHQWKLAARGAANLVRGVAVTSATGSIAYHIVGQPLYNLAQEVLGYQPVDPGTGSVLKAIESTSLQTSRYMSEQQTLSQTVDNIAETWTTMLERWFVPVAMPVENVLEARRNEAGHTLYRYIRNAVAGALGLKRRAAPKVRRAAYERTMHAVTGRYEYPPKRTEAWGEKW